VVVESLRGLFVIDAAGVRCLQTKRSSLSFFCPVSLWILMGSMARSVLFYCGVCLRCTIVSNYGCSVWVHSSASLLLLWCVLLLMAFFQIWGAEGFGGFTAFLCRF
jgi:hypothetical protein